MSKARSFPQLQHFPVPIIVSSDFGDPEPFLVEDLWPLDWFLSSSASVFIDLREHFVSCVQARALFSNLVSGKRHSTKRAQCVCGCVGLHLCDFSTSVWSFRLDKKGRTLESGQEAWVFLAHNRRKCCHTINGSWNSGKIQSARPFCLQPIGFMCSFYSFSNFETVIMKLSRKEYQESYRVRPGWVII